MRFIIEARSKSEKKKASKYTRCLEYLTVQGVSIENMPQEFEHHRGIEGLYDQACKFDPRRKRRSHVFDEDYIFHVSPKSDHDEIESRGLDREADSAPEVCSKRRAVKRSKAGPTEEIGLKLPKFRWENWLMTGEASLIEQVKRTGATVTIKPLRIGFEISLVK